MKHPIARLASLGGGLWLLALALLPLAASGQAPSIAMQSPSETVIAGQCASFSVGFNVSGPSTFQWEQSSDGGSIWMNLADGNGMSGSGTPVLVIDSVTSQMSGSQYRVVAADNAGSVTSTPVTLTVTALPAGDVVAYDVSTLAGTASGGADGTGGAARFVNPGSVAVDGAGNLFVADSGNSTIRRITPAGVVTTFAGTPGNTGSADGMGRSARFNGPEGVAVDSAGNVYVADAGNDSIRRISALGVVTTVASGAAQFYRPQAVAVDGSGNVYAAAGGSIVKVTPTGEVIILAGDGSGWAENGTYAVFNNPSGLAVDGSGNVYVADTGNDIIRKINTSRVVTTIAGQHPTAIQDPGMGEPGTEYYPGSSDGTGAAAHFNAPQGVAVDASGNVYVADTGNNTVRRITAAGVVTTIAGSPPGGWYTAKGSSFRLYYPASSYGSTDGVGSAARFAGPLGLAVDAAGDVLVADTGNGTIRSITPGGSVSTVAGAAVQGDADGTGGAAQFYYPVGVAVDYAGNAYVADTYNHVIRKVTRAGVVTTLAGNPGNPGSADGTGGAARFNYPEGVAVDGGGNLYVADTHNDTIRRITPAGVVTTLAGTAGNAGSADGTGASAQFFYPIGIGVDGAGNVYVGDSYNDEVRRVTPAGVVTTLAGSPPIPGGSDTIPTFSGMNNIAVDNSGNVYVVSNSAIQKVTPAGVVTTLAGSAQAEAGSATIGGACGIAVDGAGNVYVADPGINTISKVTPAGVVTTLTSTLSQYFSGGAAGIAAQARLGLGLAVDGSGVLYITQETPNVAFDGSGMPPTSATAAGTNMLLIGIPTVVGPPAIVDQPASQTATTGGTLKFEVAASGSPEPTYQWLFDGNPIPWETGPTLTLTDVGTTQAGTYSVEVTTAGITTESNAATLAVSNGGWLTNLSARAYLEPIVYWAYPLTAGFVTTGANPMSILVRGVGPGLQQFGVTGFLPDPSLTIYAGSTPGPTLTSWDPSLASEFASVGAFPLALGSHDTAVMQSLGPGAYTAIVNSAYQPADSGIVLAEVYDADQGAPANRLINLSARAFVGTGANLLIGGFVVGGPSAETLLIRAVGPGLSQFNIGGALAEPLLTVFDSNPDNSPAGPQVIAQIQGWGVDPTQGSSAVTARIEPATAAEMSLAGAFSFTPGSADSALVLTLPPGAYTAEVTGADGGSGVALVEIYELP
jgi:sugar lactone lactonase YvrE